MRKLFSLIAAVLFAGSMMAEAVTFTAGTDTSEGTSITKDGITISVTAGVFNRTDNYRCYANNTMTITSSVGDILNIAFTFSGSNTGGWDAEYQPNAASWTSAATSGQARLTKIVVTTGAAPAVAAPIIAGDAVFFDSTIVTMTCATTDADIYYTTDGTTDPKCDCAAAPEYTKAFVLKATTTVKAAAYTGNDWSAVAEKTFTKAPSFASFEALVAGGVADKTLIEVSFENLVITRFYESSGDNPQRKGIYFNVGEVEYEIYNSSAVVPEAWEVDGKVSGTIRGQWQHYVNTNKGIDIWEVVPMANGWAWTELTYEAPAAAGCDWDNIEFFNVGIAPEDENYNQFKICKAGENPNIVNIQVAPWADNNKGIYINFPSAEFTTISLPESQYTAQGAGILLYLSAFTAQETEVTINYQGADCVFTVYNANPEEAPAQLVAVSEETTWNFSKIAANTSNALYTNDGIQLTDESTPSKNDEVIYAEYTSDFMTLDAEFDGASMAFKGEYPIRKNKYCQAGTLHFKAAVAGSIVVKFSDTGSKASTSAVKRYLVVNGEQTEYWTSRENNGETPYAAQLDVVTEAIAVPAGDVTITGSSAIVVYYVTFTPSGATAISNTAAEDKAEKILRNGMILIVKGDKTYNVMGQIVK